MIRKKTWGLLCINIVACFSGCYHVDKGNNASPDSDTETQTQTPPDVADEDEILDTMLDSDTQTNSDVHDGTNLSTNPEPQGGIKRKIPQQVGGSGTLSEQEVSKECNKHLRSMKDCYQAILQTSPTVEGKIAIRFDIRATGQVTAVETTFNELPDEMAICLHEVFKQMVFPSPVGGNAIYEQALLFYLE